jgi:thymidine phosphorylase
VLGKLAIDVAEGRRCIEHALASGAALERFGQMVSALGGPADFAERPTRYLAAAPVIRDVVVERAGLVSAIDTRQVGLAVVALGGGRTRPQDKVDHAVGFTGLPEIGERVGPGRPIALVHARSDAAAAAASAALRGAYTVSDQGGVGLPAVLERVGGD